MKKKIFIRLTALTVMSVVFCSFTFSGSKQKNQKKYPIYHSITCTYFDPTTGTPEPGGQCVSGVGVSCARSTICLPLN